MSLTVVAAFTAAGLSLVNVLLTGRFVRRGQLEQWRREAERPILAQLLALSDKCLDLVRQSAMEKALYIQTLGTGEPDRRVHDDMVKYWDAAGTLFDSLRVQGAELELMAGPDLRKTLGELLDLHESLRHIVRPAGGADDPDQVAIDYSNRIRQKRVELVERARIDLGLSRSVV